MWYSIYYIYTYMYHKVTQYVVMEILLKIHKPAHTCNFVRERVEIYIYICGELQNLSRCVCVVPCIEIIFYGLAGPAATET